ncbi:MAG: UbiA family prenyltransferase [Chloroflexi bacterium]|nr:UbiA family prenyltransferase [Chloroflexota bacterium]
MKDSATRAVDSRLESISWARSIFVYVSVLKPRETALLTFIGMAGAIVAARGFPDMQRFLLASVAILSGSAGVNALTNYLDREIDARMERTKRRALPSKGIYPPERMLPMASFLTAIGLAIAWFLHPYAFLAGLVGTIAAMVARKTWATHFLGGFSSCAPVLVGWFALNPTVNTTIVIISLLIILWVPVHVWNLMMAYREDYLKAGVNIFPLSLDYRVYTRVIFLLGLSLYMTSIALWYIGGFGWFYLGVANIAGLTMVYFNAQLLRKEIRRSAFRAYKLSAYPFLGLTFLALCLDFWVRPPL